MPTSSHRLSRRLVTVARPAPSGRAPMATNPDRVHDPCVHTRALATVILLLATAACPGRRAGTAAPASQADTNAASGHWVAAATDPSPQGGVGRPVHAAEPKGSADERANKGTGAECGGKRCAPGEVCCNKSCGICTPPGGVCTQELCEQAPSTCSKDADCRAFSDYCTGCDCRALLKSEGDPKCSGPGVRCVADPCRDKSAVCRAGRCAIADAPTK